MFTESAVKFVSHNHSHSMPKLNLTSSPENILDISKSFDLIFAIFYLISFLQTLSSVIEGLENLAQMASWCSVLRPVSPGHALTTTKLDPELLNFW